MFCNPYSRMCVLIFTCLFSGIRTFCPDHKHFFWNHQTDSSCKTDNIFFELALIIFWVIMPSIWYIYIFLCMSLGRMKQLSKLDNKERLPGVPTALWISANHFSREAIQYQLNRCLFKGDNPSESFSWISYELD